MADRHPLDSAGRMLPAAGWPAERRAPGALELVRRFCNSTNRENGAERFDSPASLDRWLSAEGLVPVAATCTELAHLIEVREALLPLLVANAKSASTANSADKGDAAAGRAWSTLNGLVAATRFASTVPESGVGLTVIPRGTPFEQLLGRLVLTISAAVDDGSWRRLKACQHCQWVVFDPSKNRSARWCSMSVCGGRHNAREYRRRVSQR